MISWNALTLYLYISVRMSGFILFNPIFGRNSFPGFFKTGMALMMVVAVYSSYGGTVEIPGTALEFGLHLILELGLGFLISVIMHIFFYIPELAGRVIDDQMGMSMAATYDASFQSQITTTSNLLNIMMMLLFFAANGHVTLLELMMTSGDIVPFGQAAFGDAVANRVIELFIECTLLAVKMCLPILAAELMGQIGMGILMKVIPQINVFAINIELKVIVGLTMVILMLSPFSQYLLKIEQGMLLELREALALAV